MKHIFSTNSAFVAVKSDGSVVTWGEPKHGGDCSPVRLQLMTGVERVYCTSRACLAVKVDGSVVLTGLFGPFKGF